MSMFEDIFVEPIETHKCFILLSTKTSKMPFVTINSIPLKLTKNLTL